MPKQNLIIIGAGSFGREVCTWAWQAERVAVPWKVAGFLDNRRDALALYDYGVPILSSPEDYEPRVGDTFVIAIGDARTKQHYGNVMRKKGASFATIVHPTALVGRDVRIGAGSIIGPFAQLSCDIELGEHVAFGTHSNTAHDTKIGNFCQISGSCEINGNATLGEGVFLGSHATILARARVGSWAFVGAGSVVLRNVRPGARVFGNPAVAMLSVS